MQNRFNSQNQYSNVDVYSDIDTSVSRNTFSQESTEFSLKEIEQKLGNVTPTSNDIANANPDIMPSNQTINMSYSREYAPQQAVAGKMSSKTKALVITYVAVVLLLVLAVTLCGVSVGNTFGSVVALDTQYSELSTQVATLTETAQQVDYAELVERAQSLGYVDASVSSTITYTEVETRPAQNLSVQTNWFDSLCDWVCETFGV